MCSARAAWMTRSHLLMDPWGLLKPSKVYSEQCVTMMKAVPVVSSVHQDLQVWLARCQLQVWGLLRRLSATSKVRLQLTSFTAGYTVFTQVPGHIYSGHVRTAAEAKTNGQWMRELVQISLLLEKCCWISRKHSQKVISAPRRAGGCFLVRRNAASNAAACVETTLTSSAGFTRLHLLPRRTFCSERVE